MTSSRSRTRNLNCWGRRIRKGLPWSDCPTRYGNRAPTPRSKRKREARFLIKPQDKARLAAHLVLAVLPNALPQQGCANIICRHQTTTCKQSKVNRKRDQPVLSCLWLSESQNLRCHFAVFYQRVRDVFGHMGQSFGRLDSKMLARNKSSIAGSLWASS